MSWIVIGNDPSVFPGEESTSGFKVEERAISMSDQASASTALQGYDLGTIKNPAYGSGVILPINGDVTYKRPLSGSIKPRPEFGIIYPVP